MPDTTPKLGLHYLKPSDPPDLSGGLFGLAVDLDNILGGGAWSPNLISGASVGNDAVGYPGKFLRIGAHVIAKGRIGIGSSATFGTGAATINGLPFTFNVDLSVGYGVYLPNGGNPVPLTLIPAANGVEMQIRPHLSSTNGTLVGLGFAYHLGTPPQGSSILFDLDLTVA